MARKFTPSAPFVARDLYAEVTAKIVEQLEAGVRPWAMPWNAGKVPATANNLPLRHNGVPYRGVNVFLLWMVAAAKGYTAPRWLTFNQARAYGGGVKKGERATTVVYTSIIEKKDRDAAGEEKIKRIFILKHYSVFNADQCEGLPARLYARPAVAELPPVERDAAAEKFFAAQECRVEYGSNRAAYSPALDLIVMPPAEAFRDMVSFYGTLAHEHVHSTGHASRLARELSGRFGSDAYAAEELVAELGAAFTCALLGFWVEPREDHASYLASWLRVLKADNRAIFKAATLAQAAADYLAGNGGIVADSDEQADAMAEAA